MQKIFSSDLSDNKSSAHEAENAVIKSVPVELDFSLLSHVGGGLGPNGTWGEAAVFDGPNGTW